MGQNHSDAMSLRINMYNGQCAKPPDPLVKFINMILSCRTPMFMLNLFQYQHLLIGINGNP